MVNGTMTGGKALASGGYGCIFKPALNCVDPKINAQIDKDKYITKLMLKKYSTAEYNIIMKVHQAVKHIPHYSLYFLVDGIYLCKPHPLSSGDLENYNKCNSLKVSNITVKTINQAKNLNKLLGLYMPDGGTNMLKYFEEHYLPSDFVSINNSLIDLLLNGIIPMNNSSIYNADIKDTNILVKIDGKSKMETRLIDWGTCIIKTKDYDGIHETAFNKSFQFNLPFSNIMFNNEFVKLYEDYLKKQSNQNALEYYSVREFVINFIFLWISKKGSNHLGEINKIIKSLTIDELTNVTQEPIKNNIIRYETTYHYIVDYISKILMEFTIDGKFEILNYYNNIYLKNVDVWGFTMTYICVYEKIYYDHNLRSRYYIQLMHDMKHLFIHFLYENPTKIIDVDKLVDYLQSLNTINLNSKMNGGKKNGDKMNRVKKNRTKKICNYTRKIKKR